jgi:hypothetical protein
MEQENIEYVPHYCKDLTAAMGALEEICKDSYQYYLRRGLKFGVGIKFDPDKLYHCTINYLGGGTYVDAYGSTLPLAISHAIIAHGKKERP